jgi:hypothetical protein
MGTLEVSQRRIDANRRNARLSTGPRTDAGKAASRRNSLIHGLAGEGVVVPEAETQAARERAEHWNSSLRPMNAFELGLVETIAIESVRIDRCRIEERLVRDARARRSGACWFDERRAEAARLGRTLAGCPDEVACTLSTTSAGCDWLIVRWRALGKGLNRNNGWTDAQACLALDLLGVPAEIRTLDNPLNAPEGADKMAHLRDLVEGEIEALEARREEALDAVDDDLREATSMGLVAVDDPTLVLLRRYETASFRRMKWALDMLHRGRQKPAPAPTMTHDYRERARETPQPQDHLAPNPVPDPEFVPPHPDPESPAPGPESGPDRPPRIDPRLSPDRFPPARRIQTAERARRAAEPADFAGRSHLAGRLRRLARSLVAREPARRASKHAQMTTSRPACRLSRPLIVATRPRAVALRLLIA